MDTTTDTAPAESAGLPRLTWADRTRQALRRLDRYTLEVMNPGHPYRTHTTR